MNGLFDILVSTQVQGSELEEENGNEGVATVEEKKEDNADGVYQWNGKRYEKISGDR